MSDNATLSDIETVARVRRFLRNFLAQSAVPGYAEPMTEARSALDRVTRMPGWISLGKAEPVENIIFSSGAALAHLCLVAATEGLPHALWRERLALHAAEASVILAGRTERAADLRDAVHLAKPGDQPGPAGAVFCQWRQAVARPVSVAALSRTLPEVPADQIARWLGPGGANPVGLASAVLEAVLADAPRAETAALILADAVLARAVGWDHLIPLLACGLKPRDLRRTGDDLRLSCQRAVVGAARSAVQSAADLTRRAVRLRAVVPHLRAGGAADAVTLFLTQDALAPTALTGLMSDRAARRLCDRLVSLGALRELTGRDTFRLYGL